MYFLEQMMSGTPDCETVEILCTCSAGMEPLVRKELENFGVTLIRPFQGKLLFRVNIFRVPELLSLKLVERLFWCLICKDVELFENASSITSLISGALNDVNWEYFSRVRRGNSWSNPECPSIFHPHPQLVEDIKAKLFVRLRPKYLIRYTTLVHKAAVRCLEKYMGFEFSKDGTLEINLMLSAGTLFLGLPLSKVPLSKRDYTTHSGLRSTSAAAVVRNSQVVDDDFRICSILILILGVYFQGPLLLDPMCGKGILLCEAAIAGVGKRQKLVADDGGNKVEPSFVPYLIGSDSCAEQLQQTNQNLLHLQSDSQLPTVLWDLVICSVERYPFREKIFDQLVCDLPFGKKYGAHTQDSETFEKAALRNLYYHCAVVIERSLSLDGRFSMLLSAELTDCMVDKLTALSFDVVEQISLLLGTTKAVLISGRGHRSDTHSKSG
ncbi:uncharacterized protein DEA37_0003072 [Paragonimus westermani]|uniref:Ribosomal RNA large subunit methyltransferase K/L-like methyltransferase domain-containing protein n=1 Tax=Paragonimus westermani TaxID=34504 RepID=A0A5J4NBI0_9TREM|nr:uncharacterized protein DEA37_0003072 [Paragonimus westermani]